MHKVQYRTHVGMSPNVDEMWLIIVRDEFEQDSGIADVSWLRQWYVNSEWRWVEFQPFEAITDTPKFPGLMLANMPALAELLNVEIAKQWAKLAEAKKVVAERLSDIIEVADESTGS